jgi:hypothetical protein
MSLIASFQQGLLIQLWSAINRRLNRADIQPICLLILAFYSIMLSISFATQEKGRTAFGPQLGADFQQFYVAGVIFNSQTPDQIYDRDLQRRLYHELFPDTAPDTELPYVHAPFFILPFPLLSKLPYPWAYFVWLLISLCLYVSGFNLLWRELDAMPEGVYWMSLLLALSFMPFLVECLAGGQTSAFGFFCFALAISCERRGRQMLSGVALALCSYKPTLLLFILPMIVITRRFSTLIGFLTGFLFLAVVSLLLVGWQGCVSYVNTLFYISDHSTAAVTGLRPWKYVDVNSFFRLLLGRHVYLRWIFVAAVCLSVLPLLFRFWLRADREGDQSLVWASVLTWTLVLNAYVGIYEATLVVLSALLTTHAFYRRANKTQFELAPVYKLSILSLYLTPWITQLIARLSGVQLYTLALAMFGGYQLSQRQK